MVREKWNEQETGGVSCKRSGDSQSGEVQGWCGSSENRQKLSLGSIVTVN